MNVIAYLTDPTVRPTRPSNRMRSFAHDYIPLIFWCTFMSIGEAIVTVVVCH